MVCNKMRHLNRKDGAQRLRRGKLQLRPTTGGFMKMVASLGAYILAIGEIRALPVVLRRSRIRMNEVEGPCLPS